MKKEYETNGKNRTDGKRYAGCLFVSSHSRLAPKQLSTHQRLTEKWGQKKAERLGLAFSALIFLSVLFAKGHSSVKLGISCLFPFVLLFPFVAYFLPA